MAKLLDTINWIADGERATALVLNRTLKEFVQSVDNNELNLTSKSSSISVVPATDLEGSVATDNFVYHNSDGLFHRALGGDSTTDKTVGLYANVDGNYSIVFSGVVGFTGLTTGSTYYLSDTVPGGLTDVSYPGAVKVGVALSDDRLLISIGASGGSASAGVMIELDETYTLPTEFDF